MASAPSASSSATLAASSRPWSPIRPIQPPSLKPSTPAGSWITPSSVTFSLTTIFPMSVLHSLDSLLTPVLIVAAEPHLPFAALITAFRNPVKDRVVAHQELHATRAGGVGVVDGPIVQGEDAKARALGQVTDYVSAGLPRIARDDWRHLGLDRRREPPARLLLAGRETEVDIEFRAGRRHPGEGPAHPPLIRLQLLDWSL